MSLISFHSIGSGSFLAIPLRGTGGKRVKSVLTTNIGSTTTYFVGAHYEVVETNTGTQVNKYYGVYPASGGAGTQRIAIPQGDDVRKNGELFYLLSDHLGSTSIVTDASGIVVSQTKYKAWGEVRHQSGVSPTEYQYTDQYSYAADFGLLYYNARWYDPSLKRFAQADTIVPPGVQGLDRYAYVNNSPMNYVDPSGHDPWWCSRQSCIANWVNNQEKMASARVGAKNAETGNGSEFGVVFVGEEGNGDKAAFLLAIGQEANRAYDVYCSYQPVSNCGYATPAELYAAAHGTTTITFSNSSTAKFCERNTNRGQEGVICGSNSKGKIDPILVAHEMGHVFNADIHNNGYPMDDPYHDLANERINNPDFPELDVDISPEHGRNNCRENGEDYANMYSMWVFDDFPDTPGGRERRDFMNKNMYIWLLRLLN